MYAEVAACRNQGWDVSGAALRKPRMLSLSNEV